MITALAGWEIPILLSALFLGIYDVCKKHAVNGNAVMPVLFFATLSGSFFFIVISAVSGGLPTAAECSTLVWWLLLLKSFIVALSWTCVYYAMRELPISIAAPVRASSPLWTFIGSLIIFHEIPSLLQAVGMTMVFTGYYLFSVLGKLEGITFRHRGIHLILAGTLLGAGSALYDKYLLGVLNIPRMTVQFWFSVDIVFVLGAAYFIKSVAKRGQGRKFIWRWTIPVTGILLILADYLYFYALSVPEAKISILSLMRRSNCIVAFAVGCWLFKDTNVKGKLAALILILAGVAVLALFK